MLSPFGNNSPSFVIAVTAVVVAVVGYAGWSYFRPGPYAVSEHIVREFVATMSGEVREFRGELRELKRSAKGNAKQVDAAIVEIDKLVARTTESVEQRLDEAYDELHELEIRLRTTRNRRKRLDTRATEATELISDLAEEAKEKLRE